MSDEITAGGPDDPVEVARRGRAQQARELSRKGRAIWWLALVGVLVLPMLHEVARRRALRAPAQPDVIRYTNLDPRTVHFEVQWHQPPSAATLPQVQVDGSSRDVTLLGDPKMPHELRPSVSVAAGAVPGRYQGNIEFFDTQGAELKLSLPLNVVVQDPFLPFRWGLLFCCCVWALYASLVYRLNPAPRGWLRYLEVGFDTVRPEDDLRTQYIGRASRAPVFFVVMALVYLGLWHTFGHDAVLPYAMWAPKILLAGVPVLLATTFVATRPYSRSYLDLREAAGRSFPAGTMIFSRGLFSSLRRVGVTLRVWDPQREAMRVIEVWPRNAGQATRGVELPPVLGGDWRESGTPFTKIITYPDQEYDGRRFCFCYAWELKQDHRAA